MPEAPSLRCFIALEVPRDIQSQLGRMIAGLRAADADVKWVDPANIHLTLKFFGEIPQPQVAAVSAQLKLLGCEYQRMSTILTELGAFPNAQRPQIVWAGLELPKQLQALFSDIEGRMGALGFAREQRRFQPHLTLGRVRSPRNLRQLAQLIEGTHIPPVQFTFSTLALFSSTLTPAGPIYQPLTTIELG